MRGRSPSPGGRSPSRPSFSIFSITKTNKYELIDKTTTTEKGTYKFKDVPVKTYTVYCYKMSDGRKDAQQAIVKPGETITVDLKLVQ